MSDIALLWDDDAGGADFGLAGAELALDDGLKTSVIVSLFTDRRAEADDVLPSLDADRRGWWGDSFAPISGDRIGSRLWLLERSKQLDSVLTAAEGYAREALAWMIEDGVAARIDIAASVLREGWLLLAIDIQRPNAPAARFVMPWAAT